MTCSPVMFPTSSGTVWAGGCVCVFVCVCVCVCVCECVCVSE